MCTTARLKRLKPTAVMKSVGPKLVPFFKTVAIFFVLFGAESHLASIIYCVFKCLPVISLVIFVLLHGMDFSDAYAYSRKIILGLVFSALGDACLVWKTQGFFEHGIAMFALAQVVYASAFGMRPFKPYVAAICFGLASIFYMYLLPGLNGHIAAMAFMYVTLISIMLWRAIARVHIFNDLWTWTKLCSCIGAILFVISDCVIAIDKFRHPVPYSMPIIMLTYYGAQCGIALSVVDSQADELIKKST